MPFSMYQISIPVFLRGLAIASTLLDKAASHAADKGLDPSTLIEARLAPDMLTLAGQVQRASDTAKLSAVRLSGVTAPSFPDEETTFDALRERIAKTVAFLQTVRADALEGSETREVAIFSGENRRVLAGNDYLLTFALPNFFFHITTLHDILRHRGVAIGKRDYLGTFGERAP